MARQKSEQELAAARSLLAPPSAPSPSLPAAAASARATPPPDSSVPTIPVCAPRIFSPSQLGKLQEIASKVRCECTNHLAELCTSLAAFEEYSANCQSQGETDAAMHAYLYRETSRVRRLMEESLAALCRHEGIET